MLSKYTEAKFRYAIEKINSQLTEIAKFWTNIFSVEAEKQSGFF